MTERQKTSIPETSEKTITIFVGRREALALLIKEDTPQPFDLLHKSELESAILSSDCQAFITQRFDVIEAAWRVTKNIYICRAQIRNGEFDTVYYSPEEVACVIENNIEVR